MAGARITGSFDLTDFELKGRIRHEAIQDIMFKIV